MSHMSMCEAPPLRKNRMVLRAVPGAVRADRPAASGDVCANTRRSPPARAEHPAAAALRKTRRFMMAVSDVQEEGPIGEISGQAERGIGHAVERQDQRYLTRLLWEKQRRIGEISGNRAELSAGASAINQVLPLRSLQGTTMHESEAADGYE